MSVIFIHSLFRAGSTYLYNTLKATGCHSVYHEPLHEVMYNVSRDWNQVTQRTEELKKKLRHSFLHGTYFDEYAHLIPKIKKIFAPSVSYDTFFLDEEEECPDLANYIGVLIDGSRKSPVFQCTRTFGRIRWLKRRFPSRHVFLLRNPWDQWYSYKVDEYISATPRIIYSRENLPAALQAVLESLDLCPVTGYTLQDKLDQCYRRPITSETDYCLFFGLWLYAFIVARNECDLLMDMDRATRDKSYRTEVALALSELGLGTVDLEELQLHWATFSASERQFYELIEEQVLEIFRSQRQDNEALSEAREVVWKNWTMT